MLSLSYLLTSWLCNVLFLQQHGIIPRVSAALFERANESKNKNVTTKVEVSYLEIYAERIRDLLAPRSSRRKRVAGLKVREHPKTGMAFLNGSGGTVW